MIPVSVVQAKYSIWTAYGGTVIAVIGGLTQSDVAFWGGAITTIGAAAIYVWGAMQRERLKNERIQIDNRTYERDTWIRDCKGENERLRKELSDLREERDKLSEDLYKSRLESEQWKTRQPSPSDPIPPNTQS